MRRILNRVAREVQRLLTVPGEELGRLARFVQWQMHLWRFCARRLLEHNAMAMAAALCFNTLFAMIPILVLGLLVLKGFGHLDTGKQSLTRALDEFGLSHIQIAVEPDPSPDQPPAEPSGRTTNLKTEIERLVDQVEGKVTVGRLGPVGAALLVLTAINLLTSVEKSLNRVFGSSRRRRPWARRFLLYWSVLTLVPVGLLIVKSLGDAAYQTIKAVEAVPAAPWVLVAAVLLSQLLLGILLLAAVYKLMPTAPVPLRPAIAGAGVALPLWLLARWGFSAYVTQLFKDPNIYGALGLLPIFFIWLHLSWLIFLFGATFAHSVIHWRTPPAKPADIGPIVPWDYLGAVLAVCRCYVAGKGPVSFEAICTQLRLPEQALQSILDRLVTMGAVCRVAGTGSTAYVPARPPEAIRVLEVLDPTAAGVGASPDKRYDADIGRLVQSVQAGLESAVGTLSVGEVMSNGAAGGPSDAACAGVAGRAGGQDDSEPQRG